MLTEFLSEIGVHKTINDNIMVSHYSCMSCLAFHVYAIVLRFGLLSMNSLVFLDLEALKSVISMI